MVNSEPIDQVEAEVEAEPELMEADQQGPTFGPPTRSDAMINDIHERRARALERLNEELREAYDHGSQKLIWDLEAQIDWWYEYPKPWRMPSQISEQGISFLFL